MPSRRSSVLFGLVLITFTVAAALSAIIWAVSGASAPGSASVLLQGGATPTMALVATPTQEYWHRQIENEEQAYLLSVEQWPFDDFDDFVVSPMTLGMLNQYYSFDLARSSDTPVWVVAFFLQDGIQGGVPVGLPMAPINIGDVPTPTPNINDVNIANGIYWIWDANSSGLIQKGLVFGPQFNRAPQFQAIQALPTYVPAITTPSPVPTHGAPPGETPNT